MLRIPPRFCLIAGTILVGYAAVIYGIPYLLFEAPFSTIDATDTLKQRLSPEYTQVLDIRYSEGSPKLSRDGPNGTVIGYIPDAEKRQKLLQSQPFTSCPARCSSWQPYNTLEKKLPLLGLEQDIPANIRENFQAAIGKDSRCIVRYHPTPQSLSDTEIFCVSPSTGAFVYDYNEM